MLCLKDTIPSAIRFCVTQQFGTLGAFVPERGAIVQKTKPILDPDLDGRNTRWTTM